MAQFETALARVRVSRYPDSVLSGLFMQAQDEHEYFMVRDVADHFLTRLFNERLVELSRTGVQFTDKIKEVPVVLPSDLASIFAPEATDPEMRAKAGLWAYLLFYGAKYSYYGNLNGPSHVQEQTVHILLCGLDLERSSTPSHGYWTQFTDTYAEDDETEKGLEGFATCKCGWYTDLQFTQRDVLASEVLSSLENYANEIANIITKQEGKS